MPVVYLLPIILFSHGLCSFYLQLTGVSCGGAVLGRLPWPTTRGAPVEKLTVDPWITDSLLLRLENMNTIVTRLSADVLRITQHHLHWRS